MNFALSQRCDKVATGHYAKIIYEKNVYSLNIPKDRTKDQTYFLYMLNQDIMKNLLFPLEDIEKTEVKRIAKDFDISIYDKKESMGICFIGKKNFSNFIKQYINASPGDICDEGGLVLGKHNGLFNYTIGQRKGIKIGGLKDYDEKSSNIKLINTTWTNVKPKNNAQYMARFRHNGKLVPVKVSLCDNEYSLNMIELERAITPGQSAVLYENDICIGGGTIS